MGFILSWFLLAFSGTTLYIGTRRVLRAGGECAVGAVPGGAPECPPGSAAGILFGLVGIGAAVVIGAITTKGFGAPAAGYAWSVLFGALTLAFLVTGAGDRSTGMVVVAGVFALLVLAPVGMLFAKWPESFYGRRRFDGTRFDGARFGSGGFETTDRPDVGPALERRDRILIASLWLVSVSTGWALALYATGVFAID